MTSFEYIAGDPALDFVNTADWTGAGPIAERLGEYDDLVRWGMHAGLVPQRVAARLRRRALARPRDA
ncbi:MAG: ABATE domain-containing protein, partial [Gemmatimonadales bacterium]|nr:ABATE domain-containing protein [Gemmatimonadales bacterium]